jgi:hypothetical protein
MLEIMGDWLFASISFRTRTCYSYGRVDLSSTTTLRSGVAQRVLYACSRGRERFMCRAQLLSLSDL